MIPHSSKRVSGAPCRVQLQKMEIVRPPADVARYTMVFHKRDAGNEVNKDRSVICFTSLTHSRYFLPC